MFIAPMIAASAFVQPIVIAHRGASGERPEHTLEAYQLAIDQGADFIEPDLVMTKDGVLIARHENELSDSTNVAEKPEFSARKTVKVIDGEKVEGWFSEDFTLDEIKTLKARERLPQLRTQSRRFDGQFQVATLKEIIQLVKSSPRRVGIYPETKHPSYFASLGLAMEEPLVEALHGAGWKDKKAPVFIQSFESGNLRKLRSLTRLPLVQLIWEAGGPWELSKGPTSLSPAKMVSPSGLREIRRYADGVGVSKGLVIPSGPNGLGTPTSLVADSHRAGLKVHVWTFRDEDFFLPVGLKGNPDKELAAFLAARIDGFFTDFPGRGVRVRNSYLLDRR